MNLRKRGLVGLFALAVMAFALPAMASANPTANGQFLDNHASIGANETKTGSFTGPVAFILTAIPTEGVHCPTIDLGINFTRLLGHVHTFDSTGCTTTSFEPPKANLPTDATMIGSWTVDPNFETGDITITDVHINYKVTHPTTSHLVVAEFTLKCPIVHADINGSTVTINTVTLEGTVCKAELGIPPGPPSYNATISGDLHQATPLTIGLGS